MGLALGLSSALLIFLYVQYELSVDMFHKKIDRLYTLIIVGETKDMSRTIEKRTDIDHHIAPILSHDYPEITNVTRIMPWVGHIYHNNQQILEYRFWFADSNVFDMLTLPLKRGDEKTALQIPNSVVITQAMATKYFGQQDPIGKKIKMIYSFFPVTYYFTITGILEDIPKPSSLRIDFLAYVPFDRILEDIKRTCFAPNATLHTITLMEIPDPDSFDLMQEKLKNLLHFQDLYKSLSLDNMIYQIEPLKGAYMKSNSTYFELNSGPETTEESTRKCDFYLFIFLIALGAIILIISCINIVNMTTARATLRAREIGVRKVMGAKRKQLIFQFITETILLSYISLILALVLTELLLPSFNTLIKRELSVNYLHNWQFLLGMLGIATLTGFLSGIYPAFVLSAFKPVTALKSQRLPSSAFIRKGLMMLQIGVCAVVFLFALVMLNATKSIKAIDPGFNKENLVFFQINDPNFIKQYLGFKNELLRIRGVTHVTVSNFVPWRHGFMAFFSLYNQEVAVRTPTFGVDTSFMETYQIPLVEGTGFRTEYVENTGWAIVNETGRKVLESNGNTILAKSIGISSPSFWRHRVKGIMKDFFCFYPTDRVPSVALFPSKYMRNGREWVTIRLSAGNHGEILSNVEKAVKRSFPKSPFEYRYIAKEMEKMHAQKMGYRWMALMFVTGFSFFISAIGLFGFATYETERCTKEIGIRKALGAKSWQIVIQFILRFAKITLIANLLAWPVCHFTIQYILKLINYPFPVKLTLADFMITGFLTLLLTIVTVLIQTYRAARIDPIMALRYE